MTALTPYQREALLKLPRDGAPTPVDPDAAFVLRALPSLVRVEEMSLQALYAQHVNPLVPQRREFRACLLAPAIEVLYPPAPPPPKPPVYGKRGRPPAKRPRA